MNRGMGKSGPGQGSQRSSATVAVAARESRRCAQQEAVDRRATAAAARTAGATTTPHPIKPTLGLAASSLQQEWSKRLGLPSVNTTSRRRSSAAPTVSASRRSPKTVDAAPRRARQSAPAVVPSTGSPRQRGSSKATECQSSPSKVAGGPAQVCPVAAAGGNATRVREAGAYRIRRTTNPTKTVTEQQTASEAPLGERKGAVRGSEWADTIRKVEERPVIIPPAPTLAQRLNLVPAPAQPLSETAWAACKKQAIDRGDGTTQPCAICIMPFGTNRQVNSSNTCCVAFCWLSLVILALWVRVYQY